MTNTNTLPAVIKDAGISQTNYNVLKKMIFPECKDDEVLAIAVEYCRARKLDIMKKPCHIVPVWNKDKKRMVETVWPSIFEYRTTATRTGLYAGKDEPVFGDDITEDFGNGNESQSYTYPKWCSVTVYKLVEGMKCAFTGKVYWKEAAVFNNKINQPNSMWSKRTYGQLAKCAEAEALRAAFPDELGGLTTAEEMEGREVGDGMSAPTPQAESAGFHDKVKDDAAAANAAAAEVKAEDIIDAEYEEVDEPVEWDGLTLILSKEPYNALMLSDDSKGNVEVAADLLIKHLRETEMKQARINIINFNLTLVKALTKAGKMDIVTKLHGIADEGKADAQ